MQNNNSKLNTGLLVIIVVLLGVLLMQSVGLKNEKTENVLDQKIEEKVIPVVKETEKKKQSFQFLKDLVTVYPDSKISECTLSGKTYFTAFPDKVSDSGSHLLGGAKEIYSTDGNKISCPTNPMVQKDALCNQEMEMCKIIYASEKSFDGGMYDDGIDTYNLR